MTGGGRVNQAVDKAQSLSNVGEQGGWEHRTLRGAGEGGEI